MTVTLTILGCGSSAGVPRPALGWGACDFLNVRMPVKEIESPREIACIASSRPPV